MTRPEAPVGVAVLRLLIPLVVLGGYWYLLLPRLLTASGALGAVEWTVSILITMGGLGVMAAALLRIYQRLTRD